MARGTSGAKDRQLFDDDTMDFENMPHSGGFGSSGPSFTAVNHTAESTHTVSPQELFMDHSAPNSSTFTNLTTPSMYDNSPDAFSSYEASPLFSANNDVGDGQHWPSLFAEEPMYAPADTSATLDQDDMDEADQAMSIAMSRTTSTASAAEKSDKRMSISAGVHKNKRTGRLLGPIEVDTEDGAALKRAKNTMAARKSRQKKRDVEDSLRSELSEMKAQRDHWMHTAIRYGAPIPDMREPKSP